MLPNQRPNPANTRFFEVSYRFLDGPMLGPSLGDAANTFKVPASVLVDATVSYDLKHLNKTLQGFQLQVNVNNLLDETYVTGCNGYSSCYYGLPRTVYATLRYRW